MVIPDRVPSHTYMQTIIQGAVQSKLPNKYVEYLKTITDNGRKADKAFRDELGLYIQYIYICKNYNTVYQRLSRSEYLCCFAVFSIGTRGTRADCDLQIFTH